MSVAAIATAIAVSGCGSDDSGETTTPDVSIPAITSPLGTTTTAPATTTAAPQITSTTKKGNFNPNRPDSETNDVPPPPGSPQESFERQCQEHPEACG